MGMDVWCCQEIPLSWKQSSSKETERLLRRAPGCRANRINQRYRLGTEQAVHHSRKYEHGVLRTLFQICSICLSNIKAIILVSIISCLMLFCWLGPKSAAWSSNHQWSKIRTLLCIVNIANLLSCHDFSTAVAVGWQTTVPGAQEADYSVDSHVGDSEIQGFLSFLIYSCCIWIEPHLRSGMSSSSIKGAELAKRRSRGPKMGCRLSPGCHLSHQQSPRINLEIHLPNHVVTTLDRKDK